MVIKFGQSDYNKNNKKCSPTLKATDDGMIIRSRNFDEALSIALSMHYGHNTWIVVSTNLEDID